MVHYSPLQPHRPYRSYMIPLHHTNLCPVNGMMALSCLIVVVCTMTFIIARPIDSLEPELQITYYELLDIPPTANAKTLKKAYRAAALRWHPDRYSDRISEQEVAAAKFILIAEANDVLSDPQKRQEYDLLVEHGHYKYDPRVYAELMNERNRVWAERAGFTFSRRRTSDGVDVDDTWMLYVGAIFTLLFISIPLYQSYQRRVKSLTKKDASTAMLKQSIEQTRRGIEERLAATTSTTTEVNRPTNVHEAEEEEEGAATSSKSTLSAEQIAEREERRAAKLQHKKSKLLFRSMLKPMLIEVAPVADAAIGSSSTPSSKSSTSPPASSAYRLTSIDVDVLLQYLPSSELSKLVDSIAALLEEEKTKMDDAVVNEETCKAVYKQLEPSLTIVREEAAKQAARVMAEQQAAAAAAAVLASEHQPKKSDSTSVKDESKRIEWTTAELSALAKGTAKFPGGVDVRWEHITDYVNQVTGGVRTLKEVIAKSREAHIAPLKKTDHAFGVYLEKLKGKTDSANEIPVSRTNTNPAISSTSLKKSVTSAPSITSSTPTPMIATVVADDPLDEWTQLQQSSLEYALRTVPKTSDDRWSDIAQLVDGKTKRQCIARFKRIKAQIMANSNTNS